MVVYIQLCIRVLALCSCGLMMTAFQVFEPMSDQVSKTELVPIVPPTEEEVVEAAKNTIVLRALDKITARITQLEAPIGEEIRFGTLSITARYCRTRPPEETPETYAYLEIADIKRDGTYPSVFRGWMMASNPALNALEHAVYDVWVINCKAVEPEVLGPIEK